MATADLAHVYIPSTVACEYFPTYQIFTDIIHLVVNGTKSNNIFMTMN